MLTHVLSHLPPAALSDVSLVSKRFHELVTTPHAWRIAFSRFFPGPESMNVLDSSSESSEKSDTLHAERRLFARLTALASWRSEYILRTRLLRSLARGKPADSPEQTRSGSSRSSNTGNAQTTYSSNLVSTVTRLQANFGSGLNKKLPRFIHGSDDLGTASTSDPRMGNVDTWGFADTFAFRQFADIFPGDAEYGLGAGDVVGVPNMMDVSQAYGMVYGEGLPDGVLCYRSLEEKRGRVLTSTAGANDLHQGVPALPLGEAWCSLWIAKSFAIPDVSGGLIGILAGNSTGVLTAYSLGTNGVGNKRFERGEITARWVLSPGVPIITIAVDESFSAKRHSESRIWAVVLNALGEVFYLTDLPKQADDGPAGPPGHAFDQSDRHMEQVAYVTGRSVYWTLVEPTRRVARQNPFERSDVDGSYSPRSSWKKMYLNPQQLAAETKEIETFLRKKPKHFQKVCQGWDMRRRLEVDFAASDENGGGEAVVVIGCGVDEGQSAGIRRYTHRMLKEDASDSSFERGLARNLRGQSRTSIFGGNPSPPGIQPTWSFDNATQRRSSFNQSVIATKEDLVEEWRTSSFLFGGLKSAQLTTSAIDMSAYSILTSTEDPLLSLTQSSSASSPLSSPLASMPTPSSPHDIPGQRARLLAVGTKTGTIILWNMRAPTASNTILENHIKPLRIIYTDSPQISCLALTALYLVHGGNDGLVQAWDPIASSTDPIRTLNSRFSSRARRRLVQAEASPAGVGINLFAAGAICLDPEPTALRGMVSLGSHLRYWSYSSLAADQYKGNKRRLRRSERGSNQGGDRFSGTGRGALKEYIANEKMELEREKRNKRKEEERLAGRFGIDLLGPGASENEILAYATMLSEEAAQNDEARRKSASEGSTSGETIMEEAVVSLLSSAQPDTDEMDGDVAEAIRLSLEEAPPTMAAVGIPSIAINYAKKKRSPGASPSLKGASSAGSKPGHVGGGKSVATPMKEKDDLEFALQLSLAEEKSRADEGGEGGGGGKGKGRAL